MNANRINRVNETEVLIARSAPPAISNDVVNLISV